MLQNSIELVSVAVPDRSDLELRRFFEGQVGQTCLANAPSGRLSLPGD